MYFPELYVNNQVDGDRVQSSPSTLSRMMESELIWSLWIHWALSVAASVYVSFPVASARNAESLE